MYSNFPGFLLADTGARQNTNIFRVPPGGAALVKTGGMPLSQAIMPLPYKEPSGALMTLVDNMAQTGMRIGGTSEQQVGEGKTEMPVGTTLAMIEQAAKVLNSVHKRMHAAQSEEFQLLVRTFKEHPESFWQRCKRPSYAWDEQTFLTAINNCDFVPHADPNTASQAQRLVKISALKQLQQASPDLYDPVAVDTAALQAMGWANPSQFMKPPHERSKPNPEMQKAIADAQDDMKNTEARMMDSQTRAKEVDAKIALEQQKAALEAAKAQQSMSGNPQEFENDKQHRLSQERVQLIDLAQDVLKNPENFPLVQPLIQPAMEELAQQGGLKPPGFGGM
jgi:hypothetical protein